MSFIHVSFVILKHSARPLVEIALEHYASYLIKTAKGYLAYQIDALCSGKKVPDSYAARSQGYYTTQQVVDKLSNSDSNIAKDIVKYTIDLNEDDDFVIV